MKKLIKEIETRANESATREGVHSSPFEEGVAVGLNIALQIVKSHDPWIDACELPPRDEKTDDCSINVWVTDGKRRNIGFYDFAENVWIFGKAYGKVTHWAYLPEAQP